MLEKEYTDRLSAAVRIATLEAEKKMETDHIKTMTELGKFKDMYEDVKLKYDRFVGGMIEEEKDKRIVELTKEIGLLKKSNMGKGNKGEALIVNSLKSVFPQYLYEDTSKEKQTGDLHMVMEGGQRVVFESKYKETITKQDIEKFYRDVSYLQDTHSKVVGGVFVSMMTKNIPGIGEFKVEVREGVPLLFLGFEDEDDFARWFTIYVRIVIELAHHHTQGDALCLQDLVTKIRPFVNQVKCLKTSVEKMRTVHLHQLNGAVIDMEKNIGKLFQEITEILKGHDESETCLVCGLSFPNKRSLGGHMKVHKN
jgi:hypothetical protein